MPASQSSHFSSPGRAGSFDVVLDTSEVLLTTLKDASAVCTVPFLSDAAQLALGILNTVQAVRENTDAWKRLGRDAARLVAAIVCGTEDKTIPVDKAMVSHLKELYDMLSEINAYVEKQTSRHIIKRIMRFRDDEVKVNEWRDNMSQAIDLFGVRAAITNAAKVDEVRIKQDTLLEGQDNIQERQNSLLESQQEALKILRRFDISQGPLTESPTSSPGVVPHSQSVQCHHDPEPSDQSFGLPTPQRAPTMDPTYSSSTLAESPLDDIVQSSPISPTHTLSTQSPHSPLNGFESILGSAASITIISGDKIENNNHSVVNITNSHQSKNIKTVNSYNDFAGGGLARASRSTRVTNPSGTPRGRHPAARSHNTPTLLLFT